MGIREFSTPREPHIKRITINIGLTGLEAKRDLASGVFVKYGQGAKPLLKFKQHQLIEAATKTRRGESITMTGDQLIGNIFKNSEIRERDELRLANEAERSGDTVEATLHRRTAFEENLFRRDAAKFKEI